MHFLVYNFIEQKHDDNWRIIKMEIPHSTTVLRWHGNTRIIMNETSWTIHEKTEMISCAYVDYLHRSDIHTAVNRMCGLKKSFLVKCQAFHKRQGKPRNNNWYDFTYITHAVTFYAEDTWSICLGLVDCSNKQRLFQSVIIMHSNYILWCSTRHSMKMAIPFINL